MKQNNKKILIFNNVYQPRAKILENNNRKGLETGDKKKLKKREGDENVLRCLSVCIGGNIKSNKLYV